MSADFEVHVLNFLGAAVNAVGEYAAGFPLMVACGLAVPAVVAAPAVVDVANDAPDVGAAWPADDGSTAIPNAVTPSKDAIVSRLVNGEIFIVFPLYRCPGTSAEEFDECSSVLTKGAISPLSTETVLLRRCRAN